MPNHTKMALFSRKNANTSQEMSLVEHLDELRTRLLICIGAVFLTTFLAFFGANPAIDVISAPIQRLSQDATPSTPPEAVHVYLDGNGYLRIPPEERDRLFATEREHIPRMRMDLETTQEGTKVTRQLYIGQSPRQKLHYAKPLDPIMIPLKVSLVLGLLLALPILLWQIWAFVAPGLTRKERGVVRPMLLGGLVLFPLGALFAYYMYPLAMRMLQFYRSENLEPVLFFGEHLSLMLTFMIIFGIIFELPLAIAVAARVGLVTPSMLKRYRRHAYVVLAIAAILLTPADPFTMITAYVPLLVLFEISVALAGPMAARHRSEMLGETDGD